MKIDAERGKRSADGRRPRGRDLEPAQGALSAARATPSWISRATTSPSPTARCAAPAAGPMCSSATRTASTASSSTRSARPRRGRRGSRSSRCASRPAAAPRKWCRAMPPRSRGWRTSAASSSTRIRCAPTISIIPTSCASTSIRCRASSGPDPRRGARGARRRWTTSASSAGRRRRARAACTSTCASSGAGPSTRCAAPRWRWRARSSGARPTWRPASGGRKSGTASSSTTTRTRRTARSPARTRCGRRPTRACRRR